MQINFAHLNHGGINFVVFDADARSHTTQGRSQLLGALTLEARRLELRVDKAALAYRSGSRVEFWERPTSYASLRTWAHLDGPTPSRCSLS